MTTPELWNRRDVMRNELLRTGQVAEVTLSSSPATGVWQSLAGFDWPGKDPNTQGEFGGISVTPEYGKTVGWQFIGGRDFSREYATDSSGLILNEAAVKYMGLKDPVGQLVHVGVDAYPDDKFTGRVARIGSSTTTRFALLPTPNPSGNFTKITQRVPVKIDIVEAPRLLTPGMMVEVDIDLR